jgi:hypothetical protein
MASSIKFLPIPAPLSAKEDDAVIRKVDDGGFPCRRCLKDGEPGEEMLLLPYNPFLGSSPYSGAGPIYIHRNNCKVYEDDGTVPEQQRQRLLALRAYDKNHMMIDAAVLDGHEIEKGAIKLFENADVDYVHVHYASPGCFAVRLDRNS